jgi:hypothetical protein
MSHDIPDSCQACCRVHEFVFRTVDGEGMAGRESLCFGERSVVFNTCCFGQAGREGSRLRKGLPSQNHLHHTKGEGARTLALDDFSLQATRSLARYFHNFFLFLSTCICRAQYDRVSPRVSGGMELHGHDRDEMEGYPTLPCCRLLHFVFTIAGGRGAWLTAIFVFVPLGPSAGFSFSPSFPLRGRRFLVEISQKNK